MRSRTVPGSSIVGNVATKSSPAAVGGLNVTGADRFLRVVVEQERQRVLEGDAERLDDVAHAIRFGRRRRSR